MMNPLLLHLLFSTPAQDNQAQDIGATAANYYIVQPGDSLWKIAVEYQIGLSELIAANPQISDPALIYPNQRIQIPAKDNTAISMEDEVIRLINIERTKRGLTPLAPNWQLSRVARYKSEDMYKNNYFSHISPVYGSPFDMISDFGIGYSTAAENIAKGQTTAQSVVNSWMNSQGHRENILSRNYTETGVGYVNGNGVPYWTQMFIKP